MFPSGARVVVVLCWGAALTSANVAQAQPVPAPVAGAKAPVVIPLKKFDHDADATLVRDWVSNLWAIAEVIRGAVAQSLVSPKVAPSSAPKKLRAIHLIEGIDSDEIATTLRKLFSVGTVIVPVRGKSTLLIYVTDAEVKEARAVLFPLALPDELEKAPAPRPVSERPRSN